MRFLQSQFIDRNRLSQETVPRPTRWSEIIRLVATIRTAGMTAAHAATALAAISRQSGLAAALAEIGRIERSIFMLEWMLQPDLRHSSLGPVAFARSLFNRLGQIRDRSYENHQHRAAGVNLIVAAIILWNTVYLGRAVETLRIACRGTTYRTIRSATSGRLPEPVMLTGAQG